MHVDLCPVVYFFLAGVDSLAVKNSDSFFLPLWFLGARTFESAMALDGALAAVFVEGLAGLPCAMA